MLHLPGNAECYPPTYTQVQPSHVLPGGQHTCKLAFLYAHASANCVGRATKPRLRHVGNFLRAACLLFLHELHLSADVVAGLQGT